MPLVLHAAGAPEGLQRLVHADQLGGRNRRERAAGGHLHQEARGRHIVSRLDERISVVVPECVPEPVQLAPVGLEHGREHLAVVLRVRQQPFARSLPCD